MILLVIVSVLALYIVAVAFQKVEKSVSDLAGQVSDLGRRIDDEAFVCGYTDSNGDAETTHATGNPHQALYWLVGKRCELLDRHAENVDVVAPGPVERENKYDRMWFDTGVGEERFWVDRVGVLE